MTEWHCPIDKQYIDPAEVRKDDIILYAYDSDDMGPVMMAGRVCRVMSGPDIERTPLFIVKKGAYVDVRPDQFALILQRPEANVDSGGSNA